MTLLISEQMDLVARGPSGGGWLQPVPSSSRSQRVSALPSLERSKALFDREACLEIAIGKLGHVLGDEFSSVNQHPTRVRLPV